MNLWDFAVEVYARPAVEAACLELQDQHGQSVPLLLWGLWAIIEHRPLGSETIRQGVTLAKSWEMTVVGPLRRVRRTLKMPIDGLVVPGQQELRHSVTQSELRAERVLFDALAILPAESANGGPALQSLDHLVTVWGTYAPATLLALLTRSAQ